MDKVDDILVQKDNENMANYLGSDLKTFYASVECAERNLYLAKVALPLDHS